MNNVKNYLKGKQWSMGNGQCPECCGLEPFVFTRYTRKSHGHKVGCKLAKALGDIKVKVIYKSENELNKNSDYFKMFKDDTKEKNSIFDQLIAEAFNPRKDGE